jgi:hypothetical protein
MEMTSLLCGHCLLANRSYLPEPEIGLEHAFVLLIWQKKHDKWVKYKIRTVPGLQKQLL